MTDTDTDPANRPAPLREFIAVLDRVIAEAPPEAALLAVVGAAMRRLVTTPGWLDPGKARVLPGRYAQRLLYRDPGGRFSVVCFVWDAAQQSPVHDHGTWGVVGVVEGAEIAQSWRMTDGGFAPHGPAVRIAAGDVCTISLADNVHQVRNALADQPSISVHAYGADIGRIERRVFDDNGAPRPFVSGYDADDRPLLHSLSPDLPRDR